MKVDCEGSGEDGHRCICPADFVMCKVCGKVMRMEGDGKLPAHDREAI